MCLIVRLHGHRSDHLLQPGDPNLSAAVLLLSGLGGTEKGKVSYVELSSVQFLALLLPLFRDQAAAPRR